MRKSGYCVSALAVGGLLLGASLSSFAQQGPPDSTKPKPSANEQALTVRQRTELVSLTVSITDRNGRAVTGLTKQQIEVYEDKVKQKVEHYGAEDAPVSVGVIFDLSGSMRQKLAYARQALKAFIETSHAEDDFFLIGFNQQANLLAEFSDGEAVKNRLSVVRASGDTALFDAIYLGAEKIRQGRHHKRVLLVISDGQDNASRYTAGQLRQRLKELDAHVYCIGIGRPGTAEKGELREEQRGQMILDGLADLTGGRAFFINAASDLEETMTRIALELRQQYTLAYTPTNQQRDGKWRRIQVRVNRTADQPPLTIRTRSGYYASSF